MKSYRAVRAPHQNFWNIEIFNTEFQIAYMATLFPFKTKQEAEQFILDAYFKDIDHDDEGDVGEWFGPIP
jgi:hypothetical protein